MMPAPSQIKQHEGLEIEPHRYRAVFVRIADRNINLALAPRSISAASVVAMLRSGKARRLGCMVPINSPLQPMHGKDEGQSYRRRPKPKVDS